MQGIGTERTEIQEDDLLPLDLRRLVFLHSESKRPAIRIHLRRQMESLLAASDPGLLRWPAYRSLVPTLRALGLDASWIDWGELPPPPQSVLVPLVALPSKGIDSASPSSSRRVFLRRFEWTSRSRAASVQFPEATQKQVDHAFEQATGIPPGDLSWLPVSPWPEGVSLEGISLGAAAYVAAYARMNQLRVREHVVITGAVRGTHFDAVNYVEVKQKAAHAMGLSFVSTRRPGKSAAELDADAVSSSRDLLERALASSHSRISLEERVEALERLFRLGFHQTVFLRAEEAIARLLPEIPKSRIDVWATLMNRRSAVARHVGKLSESQYINDEVRMRLSTPKARQWVPDFVLVGHERQLSMTALRRFEIAQALRFARASCKRAQAMRDREEAIKSFGCLAAALRADGRSKEARNASLSALDLASGGSDVSRLRSLSHLVEIEGEMLLRRFVFLRKKEADEIAERIPASHREASFAWWQASYAYALVRLGDWRSAIDALELPGVRNQAMREPLFGFYVDRIRIHALLGQNLPAEALLKIDQRLSRLVALREQSIDEASLVRIVWLSAIKIAVSFSHDAVSFSQQEGGAFAHSLDGFRRSWLELSGRTIPPCLRQKMNAAVRRLKACTSNDDVRRQLVSFFDQMERSA